jgi:hypothetical protein
VLHIEPIGEAMRALFCFESQISSSGMSASWPMVETRRRASATTGKVLLSSIMCAPPRTSFSSSSF